MITDPIADMLTRIRNAYAVGKSYCVVDYSKIKESILAILKKNNYIEGYKKEKNTIEIQLKYNGEKPAITKIERVSKPGRRIYVKKDEIPSVLSGHGIAIISTSKGVITGAEAKEKNIGGEIIAKVY